MSFKNIILPLLFISFFIIVSCDSESSSGILVKNISEFNDAVKAATPGTTITLANGVWNDVELVFEGKGTDENPIKLTVEEKGKVTIERQSNLQLAGEHLIVEGLVFVKSTLRTDIVKA